MVNRILISDMDVNIMKNLILVIKKTVLALCLLVFALVGGCQTVLHKSDDLANIAALNDAFMTGKVLVTVKTIELSGVENTQLTHAVNQYAFFVEKWKNSIASMDSTIDAFKEFMDDYAILLSQYAVVEKIVTNHWDNYQSADQETLKNYQIKAKQLNASVNKLVTANRVREAVMDAVAFGKVVIKLAAAL